VPTNRQGKRKGHCGARIVGSQNYGCSRMRTRRRRLGGPGQRHEPTIARLVTSRARLMIQETNARAFSSQWCR
jgi:hypothetical protein